MIRHVPYVILGLAAAQTLSFAAYLAAAIFTVPFWDTLDWIDAYYGAPDLWTWLWQQHGDVRTLASKALLAADLYVFGGALYPIAALAFVAMIACLFAVAHVVRDDQKTRLARAFAGALPFILLFQTFTLPSYMAPNTVQHAMALVFFLCAVLPLIGPPNQARVTQKRFLAVAVAASLATLAYPNGFIAWIAAAWLTWRQKYPITWTLGLIALCALAAGAYFSGYRWGDGHPNPAGAFEAPGHVLRFVVSLLSVPWIRHSALEWPGLAIGVVLVGVGSFAFLRETVRRGSTEPTRLLATTLFAFAIGSALMIASVRADLTDIREGGTRFGIFAAVAQLAAALYLMPAISRFRRSPLARPGILATGAGLALILAAQQVVIGDKAVSVAGEIAQVRQALQTGEVTRDDLTVIYPDPQRAGEIIALIRSKGHYGLADVSNGGAGDEREDAE